MVLTALLDIIASSRLYDLIGSSTWLAARSPFMGQCKRTPGGFLPLEMIYDNQPVGDSILERWTDRYYLQGALARAARVRLRQATIWLRQQVEIRAADQGEVEVLSLASGGARDAIEVMADVRWRDRMAYVGVDIAPEAVTYAQNRAATVGLNGNFHVEVGNALRPPLSWRARFGIVTSLGLFDYLDDRLALALINRVYTLLHPGGAFLFGMVTSNPNQRFFEEYLNWRMHYRSPEHILGLAASSRFQHVRPVSQPDDYFFLVECQRG